MTARPLILSLGLLVVACGDNFGPLADATLRNNVHAFANAGFKLLIEGGELSVEKALPSVLAFESTSAARKAMAWTASCRSRPSAMRRSSAGLRWSR